MQIVQPEDGKWGSKEESKNGSSRWNGMVEQLQMRNADICGASLTITEERSKVIDFTIGILEDQISLIILNPLTVEKSQDKIKFMVYITIFTKAVWLAILSTATLYAIAYGLLQSQTKSDFCKHFLVGLGTFFLSLIQRNADAGEALRNKGEKLTLLSISAMSYILLALYGGDLTATMTASIRMVRLRSFEDTLQEEYKILCNYGGAHLQYFINSQPGTATN